tara:strand:+ start:25 stop:627 length:603 start_codon:yes stop_codon:yes gene_type:complete
MKNNNSEYSIGEISKITGVSASAINYYVRSKILESPKKLSKTRSIFNETHIEKIKEIKKLKDDGFPLKLIKKRINSISTEIKENFTVDEILSITNITNFFYEELLSNNLIDKPKNLEGNLVHPSAIIKLIISFKTLVELGVTYETLKRHNEYKKLSEAEAYFLMEHLADAIKNKSKINEFAIVEAFENIRQHSRMVFFND